MDRDVYVHLELRGSSNETNAFVEGFRIASRVDRVFYAARENVHLDGFLDSLISRAHRCTHVLLPASMEKPLMEAFEVSQLIDVQAAPSRVIDHAELTFEFRCFAREDGVAIRAVVETEIPEGVDLESYTVKETVNEDAKGPEMYSPVHEYILNGEGRFVGPIVGIIELGRRLDDQEFVHREKIKLVHAG
ncbi:MAG: hypothetical protein K8R59_01720 [Thermoanaerobaculales bacterium]|nr:hypothetical protein [Thermoanaerobaculales bacterium]